MRIAHVANFYGPASGGLRTTMHALGRGYLERGHEVLLVVPGQHDLDEETSYGRRVSIASPVLPLSGGYRVITRVHEVHEALEGFAPDVLEVSDRTTLRSLGTWAREHGIPSVFFAHERADGVLAARLPRRWAEGRFVVRAADWHNRITARGFSRIVCTTDYAGAEFARIGASPIKVPLGVDLDHFTPGRHDPAVRAEYAAPHEPLLLMASRLSSEKRPLLGIDAVRILTERGAGVRLVVAGAGAMDARVRERARGLPVEFIGFVKGRDRFASLLASADVVIAPGPIETFGLAAAEALASGTPVVVNARSALPEVVGAAGAVAADDPASFADAVESVLARDRHERRREARARAESMPWSHTVDRMLSLHGAAPVRTGRER